MDLSVPAIEIEVKLRPASRDEAIERLGRLPATLRNDRHFEDNEIYDTGDGSLSREGRLLRLRMAEGRGILTFKEKVETDLRAKVRREVETRVDSPEAIREILRKLGLVKVYRYQKYRCYYVWNDPGSGAALSISLDDTPIGVFVELEGPKESIDRAAARMGYTPQDYILEDYRSLHLNHLKQLGREMGDMVFADGRGE